MDRGRQSLEDRTTTQGFLDEGGEISRENPEKVRAMIDILQRIVDRGTRVRNGPTKGMLLRMQELIPGDFQVSDTGSKADIVEEMLGKLRQEASVEAESDSDVAPEDIPEGWGDEEGVIDGVDLTPLPLLRFRRNEYSNLPKDELLGMLLDEQEKVKLKKRDKDAQTLDYARKNLQEMAEKTTPLPPNIPDKVVWFLYESQLKKVIREISTSEKAPEAGTNASRRNTRTRDGSRMPDLIEISDSDSSTESEDGSSDSDLESYSVSRPFPHKHFKPRHNKRKRKRKKAKKRKRKRKKRKKRKRRRHSSHTSSSSTSSSEEAVEPNGRRVSSSAYDSTHYERLREFKEGYDEWVNEAGPADWPEDSAIDFIAKKFARPGTKFAHKSEGVKRKFVSKDQVDFAKNKTRLIYGWANDVANLRLERHQQLSKAYRRAQGASAAKKARIKQKAGTFKRASVSEEQTLVAKIGVCCDLVCLGKKSWNDYHYELKLGGQREAVIESSGGGVSKAVAGKAWKAAQSAAIKPLKRPVRRHYPCYWCSSKGHEGKSCPIKKAGRPPLPGSKAEKWPKKNIERAMKGAPVPKKVRIEKP